MENNLDQIIERVMKRLIEFKEDKYIVLNTKDIIVLTTQLMVYQERQKI